MININVTYCKNKQSQRSLTENDRKAGYTYIIRGKTGMFAQF